MVKLFDQIRAAREAKPNPLPEVIMLSERDAIVSWERLVRRLLQTVAVTSMFLTITEELPQLASEGSQKTAKPSATITYVPKAEVVQRPLLTQSKTKPRTDPSQCSHPKIVNRGGHAFWWTCELCGTRWERAQHERIRYDQS